MSASGRYVVATDGACKGNPGPTGWAWVAEDGHWSAGSIPDGTNNIGELLALLYALRDHAEVRELVIQADSLYVINTYTKWMDGHRNRGWLTSAKQPVANVGILEQLIVARDARRAARLPDAEFEHVRGHSGHRLNGWADERAVRASNHGAEGRQLVWGSHHGHERIDVAAAAPRSGEDRPRKKG